MPGWAVLSNHGHERRRRDFGHGDKDFGDGCTKLLGVGIEVFDEGWDGGFGELEDRFARRLGDLCILVNAALQKRADGPRVGGMSKGLDDSDAHSRHWVAEGSDERVYCRGRGNPGQTDGGSATTVGALGCREHFGDSRDRVLAEGGRGPHANAARSTRISTQQVDDTGQRGRADLEEGGESYAAQRFVGIEQDVC